MLEESDYKKKLHDLLDKIKDYFDFSTVRGGGVASFIFAEKGNQTVEIYQSEDSIIVEFWENKNSSSFEKEVNSYEEAANLAVRLVNKQI